MPDLHRFLTDYNMAMLRALAQHRGVALTTNRQTDAVDQLTTALVDPLSLRTALARLSSAARNALDALSAAGGRMRASHFDRRFGQVRPIGPGRLERATLWQEPANPAEELWYAGLVFRAFVGDEDGPGEFVFIPDDLLPLLPQPQTEPPILTLKLVPAPANWDGKAQTQVHDLFVYLVYLQTHDVRTYADGRLGRHDRSALRQRLAHLDERRFAFVRHLAQRMGFVTRQDRTLHLQATPVKRWLAAPPARQVAALQEAWRDDPTWNDLCHVPGLICDQETDWQNDPVRTRLRVLALLTRCPPDAWWSAASFVAAVKEIDPDFQRPDGDYTSWYIRAKDSTEYLSGFESWDRVEGALITDLLAGPLCWLDLVASVRDGEDLLCRLTEAGTRFLGLTPFQPDLPPSPSITVQPDFVVQLPAPVNLYTRFQLERFADLESVDPCRYRLTVGGLGRALARGLRVEQILAFLQQTNKGAIPTNVTGQLQMWAGRFGQVELEEMAMLRVKNERFLKELSVLPETRSLIARVLSPTSALVRRRDLPRLRKELRGLGYFPPEKAEGDREEHD